jgi:predicted nucleic acid-binding protein
MNIVIDANITVALFVNLPYSSQAERLFRLWRRQDIELFAPGLWPAEVISALRKVVTAGQMGSDDARLALASLERFPVQVIVPDAALMDSSLLWAEKLNQTVAYDAQYIALAESLAAEFWTADQRLIRSLQPMHVNWIHWVRDVK